MNAAVLHEYGATPRFGSFPDPSPEPGHVVIDVAAAALHHLDLHKATGGAKLVLVQTDQEGSR